MSFHFLGLSCCRCNCISQGLTPLEPEESIEPHQVSLQAGARLLFFFFSVSKMEAQIKNLKLELSNERIMRHEGGKEVSKQATNNFIIVTPGAPWLFVDIKHIL